MRTRGFEVVKDDKRKFPEQEIRLPERGTSRAMAYDFFANADYEIKPGEIAKIWTDVKAYMGDTECLVLNVRSSMGGKFMLANTAGWIDADYYGCDANDGNIGVFLKNISDSIQYIKKGESVAQGAFFNFLVADNGNTDAERTGGFGSTGTGLKESTNKIKFFNVHFNVPDAGYSVCVAAFEENEAVEIIKAGHLYEEGEDLSCIDYIDEITKQEFMDSKGVVPMLYGALVNAAN